MPIFGHKGQLDIPPVAKRDGAGVEIARVWAAEGAQHVSLRPDIWEDPFAWGIMLADFAQHVTNAYEQLEGRDRDEALRRIREGLDAELDGPTDEVTGSVDEAT